MFFYFLETSLVDCSNIIIKSLDENSPFINIKKTENIVTDTKISSNRNNDRDEGIFLRPGAVTVSR